MQQRAMKYLAAGMILGTVWVQGAAPQFLRAEQLEFVGNKAYTADEIRIGLCGSAAFLAAGHPLAGGPAKMAEVLASGYRSGGFPFAKVEVVGKSKFKITEGQRFKCGRIITEGVGREHADILRNRVLLAVAEDAKLPEWRDGQPVVLDPKNFDLICLNSQRIANDLGLVGGQFVAQPVLDRKRGVCDLNLKWESLGEGVGIVIEEVEIRGLKRHTQEAVLDYLKFKPGMPLAKWNGPRMLFNSGRFTEVEADSRKGSKPFHWKMILLLQDYDRGPLLGQPMPVWRQAAMDLVRPLNKERFGVVAGRDTILTAKMGAKAGEKFFEGMFNLSAVSLQIANGAGKKCFIFKTPDANGSESLVAASITKQDGLTGLIAGGGLKKRWLIPPGQARPEGGLSVHLTSVGAAERGPDGSMFRFQLGVGFSSDLGSPLELITSINPLFMVHSILRKETPETDFDKAAKVKTVVREGLKIETIQLPGFTLQRKWIVGTGELVAANLRGQYEGDPFEIGWVDGEDLAGKLIRQTLAETKTFPNQYDPKQPLASGGRFIAESFAHAAKAMGAEGNEMEESVKSIVEVVQPFKIWAARLGLNSSFNLPNKFSGPNAMAEMLRGVRGDEQRWFDLKEKHGSFAQSIVRDNPELFFKAESWAPPLAHQLQLMSTDQTEGAAELCLKLHQSGELGPVGHLLVAQILNELENPEGGRVAQAGLKLMNVAAFDKDLAVLAGNQSPVLQAIQRLADHPSLLTDSVIQMGLSFGNINLSELSVSGPQIVRFLKERRAELKAQPEAVLKNMITAQWPNFAGRLGTHLELESYGPFKRLQAAAQQGSAQAQFHLGLCHAYSIKGLKQNLAEAYVWATLAARQSHPDATRLRIQLIRQMTPDQLVEGSQRILERK